MVAAALQSSDEVLAARAAGGDDDAFETLVRRYQRRILGLACRLTSETDAPDVLQETFLQLHLHLPSFRGEARFSTWLYRVATNAALMHRRARATRPTESLDAFLPRYDARGELVETPEALQVAACADQILDRKVLAERAHEALGRLPDLYREAFVLRDLEELSTAEVAQVLSLEPAAVRQRVHRARLMMRGFLSGLVGATR
jgi:RNA polymerase sigma-70 factor, ECF subfamily